MLYDKIVHPLEFVKAALNKSEFGVPYLSNCCISFFNLEGTAEIAILMLNCLFDRRSPVAGRLWRRNTLSVFSTGNRKPWAMQPENMLPNYTMRRGVPWRTRDSKRAASDPLAYLCVQPVKGRKGLEG
jgi:hypothetical protein